MNKKEIIEVLTEFQTNDGQYSWLYIPKSKFEDVANALIAHQSKVYVPVKASEELPPPKRIVDGVPHFRSELYPISFKGDKIKFVYSGWYNFTLNKWRLTVGIVKQPVEFWLKESEAALPVGDLTDNE